MVNKKDFNDFKKYAEAMYKDNVEEDYMEGYINAMIDYKIINTCQAEELVKMKEAVYGK